MTEQAIVTGAGSGIGRAVALRLAERGYRVVVLGRRADALRATVAMVRGDDHLAVPGDLTEPATVEAVVARVRDECGEVDALVHCAGGGVGRVGADPASLRDHLHGTFDVNVSTVAMLTEALEPVLRDDRGRVVTTSSIAAFRGGGVAYATAKAALHGWAFDAARRLGPRGVTVNVVAPGYVTGTEFFGDSMSPERHARLVGETLVGRAGDPDDVAALVEYLVSADARHVTAQVLQVNGGALAR